MNAAAKAAAPTNPQTLVAAGFAAACLPRLINPGPGPGPQLDSAPSRELSLNAFLPYHWLTGYT